MSEAEWSSFEKHMLRLQSCAFLLNMAYLMQALMTNLGLKLLKKAVFCPANAGANAGIHFSPSETIE
jgi:hypothetical protein